MKGIKKELGRVRVRTSPHLLEGHAKRQRRHPAYGRGSVWLVVAGMVALVVAVVVMVTVVVCVCVCVCVVCSTEMRVYAESMYVCIYGRLGGWADK